MIAYLYVIILTSGTSHDVIRRFEFSDIVQCEKQLKNLKTDNKKDSTVVTFCANQNDQRYYNATWWKDAVK